MIQYIYYQYSGTLTMGSANLVIANQSETIPKKLLGAFNKLDKEKEVKITNPVVYMAYNQFHKIKEWKVPALSIFDIQSNGLIRQISQIQFSLLKRLNLVNNNIESVEGLNRIAMPVIETVVLDHNKITTLSDVTKWSFKRLSLLSFRNNHIKELGWIWRLESGISVDCERVNDDNLQCQSSECVAKMYWGNNLTFFC